MALLLLAAAALQGCLHGAPRRPVAAATGPGSSAREPILVSGFDDEVRYIQGQACPGGGHPVVGDDFPLFSGERRCFLDRVEGSCGSARRAWYFMLCE
ncbi:MAG: hypothetical protein NVSMB23_30700 [Myxococcales bacterium]